MTNHIAVCKIEYDEVVILFIEQRQHLVSHFVGAHLRLQVIGSNLGRRHQQSVLMLSGCFDAAVEEEGDVSVLLGLGYSKLGHARILNHLSESVVKTLGRESDGAVGHRLVIVGHADIGRQLFLLTLKSVKFGIDKSAGHLAGTVGAEVKKDDGIAVLYPLIALGSHRDDKFIGDACLIACLYRRNDILKAFSLALGNGVVAKLYTLPALISVHGVISARNGGAISDTDALHLGGKLTEISGAALGVGITSVKEAVHRNVLYAAAFCKLQKGIDMAVVAVHAAIRNKSRKMQRAVLFKCIDSGVELLVLKEIAVGYRFGDSCQLLINNSARSDISMSNFGIAHLSVGQTDIQTRSAQRSVGPAGDKGIYVGRFGGGDGVALLIGVKAKAVKYHKHNGSFQCNYLAIYQSAEAALTISLKSGALSEAPPISPPSMSG